MAPREGAGSRSGASLCHAPPFLVEVDLGDLRRALWGAVWTGLNSQGPATPGGELAFTARPPPVFGAEQFLKLWSSLPASPLSCPGQALALGQRPPPAPQRPLEAPCIRVPLRVIPPQAGAHSHERQMPRSPAGQGPVSVTVNGDGGRGLGRGPWWRWGTSRLEETWVLSPDLLAEAPLLWVWPGLAVGAAPEGTPGCPFLGVGSEGPALP